MKGYIIAIPFIFVLYCHYNFCRKSKIHPIVSSKHQIPTNIIQSENTSQQLLLNLSPSTESKFYADILTFTFNRYPSKKNNTKYELELHEDVKNSNQFLICLFGAEIFFLSKFLRASAAEGNTSGEDNSTSEENKIISNDFLPNCSFIHCQYTSPDLNFILQIGDLCCFVLCEEEESEIGRALEIKNEYSKNKIFTRIIIYIHWNSQITCKEQYSHYVQKIKREYELREDLTYAEWLFRDKRRNLHFIFGDTASIELFELHNSILRTWKNSLVSITSTRDELELISPYDKMKAFPHKKLANGKLLIKTNQ